MKKTIQCIFLMALAFALALSQTTLAEPSERLKAFYEMTVGDEKMKTKCCIAAVVVMLIIIFAFSCFAEETGEIKTGIIGAMDEEVATLKEALIEENITTIVGMEFYEGKLDGKAVVVVKCSVGKVNAAACAQILISVFEVDRIINTGVAGSLNAEIDIGDIVVSTDAVQHDMDVTALGFPRGEIPYSNQFAFSADEEMRKNAVQAVKETAPDIHVFEGRVCSGDQFIASRKQKEAIISEFGGLCCEMEGAAIAQVCCLNGKPFVIIRAISDKADDSEEMSYVEFEKAAAERCAGVTRYMIAH